MVTLDEIALAFKAEVDANNIIALDRFFTQFNKLNEKIQQSNAQQAQIASDARRVIALAYIATLNLSIIGTTNAEKKTRCYNRMEFCRNEMNGKDGETRQELQKKIDELLVLANQYKDLQRAD